MTAHPPPPPPPPPLPAWISAASTRTSLPRPLLAAAAALCGFGVLFLGFGSSLFSVVVATLYPTYASFKAIEGKDVKEDAQWLSYWALVGLFYAAETLGGKLLVSVVPFYYALKVALLLYAQLPQLRGSEFGYAQFVRPWFVRNEPAFERQLARLQPAGVMLSSTLGSMGVTVHGPPGLRERGAVAGATATTAGGEGAAGEATVSEIFGGGGVTKKDG